MTDSVDHQKVVLLICVNENKVLAAHSNTHNNGVAQMAGPTESAFGRHSLKGISLFSRVCIPHSDGCSLAQKSALSNYEREMEKRETIQDSMNGASVREEELLRRNKTLSAELEHRMLNNIQIVASILNLQSRAAHNKETADLLRDASRRLVALGRLQRRLHTSEPGGRVELRSYLEALGNDIAQMTRGHKSTIHVAGDIVAISSSTCSTLGLIVNELVTNALKYAPGNINLRVEQLQNNMCRVSVADEGPGFGADFSAHARTGKGLEIIQSLAQQIDGRIEIDAGYDRGAKIDVLFLYTGC